MNRHYTYDEIKKAVHDIHPMTDDMTSHLCECEECMNKFMSLVTESDAVAVRNVSVNVIERVCIRNKAVSDMMYNLRVVFGVFIAIMMLFAVPMPTEAKVDKYKKDYDRIVYVAEKKEEFMDDFFEGLKDFTDFYTKGQNDNDKTEK